VLVILALLGVGARWWIGKKREASKTIDQSLLTKVKRGDLEIAVIETGKVQPREKVEVKSKVAGQVEKVFVEEGAKVKRGQPLLRLDATDFRRDVARAEADVAQAKNGLEFAELNLERRKRGLESRGVAQIDVDVAQNEVKAKGVALRTAQVALGAAEDRLRYTRIDAPMDGTVIQRGIEEGEVVTPGVQATFEGKALLTVADMSALIVKVDLNQIDVAKVKIGQEVTLALDALPGKKYTGKVSKIAPAASQLKGKDIDVFPVEATLTDGDAQIKPGMTADVRIHIETRKGVLSLPIEGVAREAGKSFVTRVLPGEKGAQKTEKVEVQVGARNDREIEIASGIGEGDQVLIKPASSAENEYKM
jgi:membrane fusion protein, macrolide-specific efflux system